MKKTFHFVLKPTWGSTGSNRWLKTFTLEGPFVKKPPPSKGMSVELELDVDEGLFTPPQPKVSMKLDRDDTKNEIRVTGFKVRSEAAKNIIGPRP